jgi:hypothetical protein
MLLARYEVQEEVRARQMSQRREAERWRFAKAVRGSREPASGGLLCAVTKAMSRIRRAPEADLGAKGVPDYA